MRASAAAARFAFVTLTRVRDQRRQVHAFDESGAAAHANLFDEGVVCKSDRDATIISNAATVSLIAENCAAILAVRCEKMASRRNNRSLIDGQFIRNRRTGVI